MAFATTGNEEKKVNKKKEFTCYKCGKSGHYSNECDEVDTMKTSNTSNAGKKGSNFLVLKEDINDSSSEDEKGIVSTFNEEKELQMSNDDKRNCPMKKMMMRMRPLMKKMMTKMKTLMMMTSTMNILILTMTMKVLHSYKKT